MTAEPTHLAEVTDVTGRIVAMAGGSGSADGSGGMATKVEAARIAVAAGCHLCIARGAVRSTRCRRIEDGARCTWFVARQSPLTVRKQWIAGTLRPAGDLVVDVGAAVALRQGKSLLPAGLAEVHGRFDRGDAVRIVDGRGVELARGLSAYSSEDAARIAGAAVPEIESLLGYRGRDEVVHRDDLVLVTAGHPEDTDD